MTQRRKENNEAFASLCELSCCRFRLGLCANLRVFAASTSVDGFRTQSLSCSHPATITSSQPWGALKPVLQGSRHIGARILRIDQRCVALVGRLLAGEQVQPDGAPMLLSDVFASLPPVFTPIVGDLAAGSRGLHQFIDMGDLVALLQQGRGQRLPP